MKRYIKFLVTGILLTILSISFAVATYAGSDNRPTHVSSFEQTKAEETTVTLSWRKVKGADKYKVYKYNKNKKKYELYGTYNGSSCTVKGLKAGTDYKFRVYSVNVVNGKNIYSEKAGFTNAVTKPTKVQELKCTNKKKSSFVLKWESVKNADGYTIYIVDKETDKWKPYKTTQKTSITLKKEGVYRVSAYCTNGKKKFYGTKSAKKIGSFKYVKSTSGVFTFTSYGIGHGVGMSQSGAEALAKKGWKYDKILKYYYTGTEIKKHKKMPEKVEYGDKKYSLKQYLRRVTQAEIGGEASYETIKAQVVACYTYAKSKNFKLSSYDHAFSSKSKVSDIVKKAVNEVVGEYVSYDGKTCLTAYHSLSAGKTASSKNAWGVTYPYLDGGVESSSDRKSSNWKTTIKVTSEEMKETVKDVYGITLKGDPASWIKIMEKDNAVSSYIGYVSKIKVGSKTITGEQFKGDVLKYKIKSHCFTVKYTPDS